MLKITVSWLESFRFSVTLSAPKTLVIIMNYAIEFHDANYPFLNVAARKKIAKAQFTVCRKRISYHQIG